MTLSQRVWALVPVRAEERGIVQLVLYLAACNSVVRLFGSTAAYALFLDAYGAQSLPLVYIGTSVVSTLISLLYLRLERRFTLAQLLVGQLGLVLLTLVGYRLGLASANRTLLFTLPIYDGVVSTLMYMAFWNLLGRLYNLQQGKRLFGLFGAGQEVATIASGFLVPVVVPLIGTVNLLWGAIVAGAGALTLLLMIIRRTPAMSTPSTDDQEQETEHSAEEAPTSRNLLTDPYIALLLAMYICFGLGDYFVDNIFYLRVEAHLTNPDQLAGFLSVFASVVSGLSLCSHLFLSSYVLRRYGVRTIILLTPLLLLMTTFFFTLGGILTGSTVLLFWLAVGMNLTRQVTDAFDNTAANLLYQPLPTTVRMRTQTAVDGIIYPVAAGLAGLLLLYLTNYLGWDGLQLALVLLPLVAIWLVTTIALGRAYPQRVQQALRQRLVRGNQLFTPDRVSLDLLRQHLHSPHPGAVLYALDLLATYDREAVNNILPPLLTHPAVEVRLAVIAQIETLGSSDLLTELAHCFATDPDEKVRSAALRARATIGGTGDDDSLHEHLTAPNLQLRQGVMVGLLRSGELEGILAVGTQLAQLVQSPNVTERVFAANVLGESGVASFYRPLLQLLRDPVPAVRRAGLSAAGKLQQPKLWSVVVEALASTSTRSAAQTALIAGGNGTLIALAKGWANASRDPQLRHALARTCGRLRSDGAAALLVAALDDPDVTVRTQLLTALQQCSYQATATERARVEAAIEAELAHAAWTIAGIIDLTDEPLVTMIHDALLTSLQQQMSRLFDWLSFLYDPLVICRVRDAFTQATTSAGSYGIEQRAYALETLDLFLVSANFKERLITLYDDQPLPAKLAKLALFAPQPQLSPATRLHTIIAGPTAWLTPWLHATALYKAPAVAVTCPDPLSALLVQAVTAATSSTNALVYESAQWAAQQFPLHQAADTLG